MPCHCCLFLPHNTPMGHAAPPHAGCPASIHPLHAPSLFPSANLFQQHLPCARFFAQLHNRSPFHTVLFLRSQLSLQVLLHFELCTNRRAQIHCAPIPVS